MVFDDFYANSSIFRRFSCLGGENGPVSRENEVENQKSVSIGSKV